MLIFWHFWPVAQLDRTDTPKAEGSPEVKKVQVLAVRGWATTYADTVRVKGEGRRAWQ